MTEKYITDVCVDAITHYGAGNQVLKAIEEMGELQIELSRSLARAVQKTSECISASAVDDVGRVMALDESAAKVMEEAADVQIMVMQLALIYDPEMFSRQIEAKLIRLEQRIKDEYRRAESD